MIYEFEMYKHVTFKIFYIFGFYCYLKVYFESNPSVDFVYNCPISES